MLGIKINNQFLDLSPGTSVQIERISPFFNFEDLSGEYTLPLTFPYTPKNSRQLDLPNHYYTKRLKSKFPAQLYDNNNFSHAGDLIVQTASLNVNDINKSSIDGFFVTGISSFFQLVKNKKLKDLFLGGIRSFAWTNNDPDATNNGFWQHIHKTLDGTMDYSFAPIRNEKWSGSTEDGTPDWINKLDNTGKIDYDNNFTTLAPQVSLKYLLTCILEEHNWQLDHSEMNGTSWDILFIPSFYSVSWKKIVAIEDPPYFLQAPLPNIDINLQNHVPPEMYISNFIIALRNRYNWGFDFDSNTRVCKMRPLKNLAIGTKKDWTRFMAAKLLSSFSEDPKVFSFTNEIDSHDDLSSAPDFDKPVYGAPVETFADLPAAAEGNFNNVIYVFKENKFYQCHYNETDLVYQWDIFADNIYDYKPAGSNTEIPTVASTMPVYKTLYRDTGITEYYGLFPLCSQEGNWEGKQGDFVPWGLRTLFHRGMVWEALDNGTTGAQKYPYLTSIAFTITQEEPDLDWSNVYVHDFTGINLGIINYWWKDTLKYIQQTDIITLDLYLPRTELVNFRWSDVIILRNIPYAVQKITESIPYPNFITTELRRIG